MKTASRRASALTVGTVALPQAQEFLEREHRQGSVVVEPSARAFGLYEDSELLGLVLFGIPRTKKKRSEYSQELIRMAFKSDLRIHGGASRLIKHYIRECKPADFFTYQDTAGEATSVYEHAGMTLVSQAKKKQYLVAPGKTLQTGNRKQVLGLPYAIRYGPDRILGTKLGEVMDPETGKRKSNVKLFLELGWHIEETTGDRVYEWVDPNRTYYTYKITASDSDKYYYGVSHVKKANATLEDCLNDGYYGSGNKHFKYWRKAHSATLKKTICGRFSRKASGYQSEKKLIGNYNTLDPNCLNVLPEGIYSFANVIAEKKSPFTIGHCPTHGETIFRGDNCDRCSASKRKTVEDCPIHGMTNFYSGYCVRCHRRASMSLKECPVHGFVQFQGESCVSCYNLASVSLKRCPVHGEVKHKGDSCITCVTTNATKKMVCAIHGEVTHQGITCSSCSAERLLSLKNCPVHGETTHRGENCLKCSNGGSFSSKKCAVHGVSTHHGAACLACVNEKSRSLKECAIHGLTKHLGEKCNRCTSLKRVHTRYHKEKRNDNCSFCIDENSK